jgi:hypothetical protein
MKDALLDIVQHTHNLGVIDLVKITGTDKETTINAVAEDRSAILEAVFHNPVADFVGTFGMPNLSKLNTILNLPVYQEDAQLTINRQVNDGVSEPCGIHFETKAGDFKNDYRFMGSRVINEKVKNLKFKGVKWGGEFEPSVLGIQRFAYQCQAASEEVYFVAKTEGTDLKFYFGDAGSNGHAGNFVFVSGVSGSVTKSWNWPIAVVKSILGLPGDKSMRFSDEGAAQITVDSGVAVYNYTIPAQQK